MPYAQFPVQTMAMVLRTDVPPRSIAIAAERALHELDAQLPVARVATLEEVVARSISEPRFYTLLLGAFAGTALFLAALGLFGVMSYAVAQRTRELAVRLALGARQQELRRMVLREALVLGSVGLALGLGGALLLSRTLTTLLFSVSPNDPATLAAVGALLLDDDRARRLSAGAARDAHRPGGGAARGLRGHSERAVATGDDVRRDRIGPFDEPIHAARARRRRPARRARGAAPAAEGRGLRARRPPTSPAAVLAAARGARVRRGADGPQLHARHHLGPRGAGPADAGCRRSTRRCRWW